MSPSRLDVRGPWIQPSSEHDSGLVPHRPHHGVTGSVGVEPSGITQAVPWRDAVGRT
jgi:hypothetical protein